MDKKKFNDVLSRINLAFSQSPTKGIIFWYNVLLPDSKANTQANNKVWKNLENTFAKQNPDQIKLVLQVVKDLQYVRKQVLKNKDAREMVEKLKGFLVQSIASKEILNSLQQYAYDNSDKVKAEIKSKK